jgi:hypothetical protein
VDVRPVSRTFPPMDPEDLEDEELEEIRSVYSITLDIMLKPRISVATKISPLLVTFVPHMMLKCDLRLSFQTGYKTRR